MGRETQQREVISVDDDVVNTINSKTENIKISQMKSSPYKTTNRISEDSSIVMDTNDALWNAIADGTTQCFGTGVSNGDVSEKEEEEESTTHNAPTATATASHNKRFAKMITHLQ
jgi:hypothetical protein